MIDTSLVQVIAHQTITVVNAITGLIVSILAAGAYIWGHSHGVKKVIRESEVKKGGGK